MANSTTGVSIFAIEAGATFLAFVAALLVPRLGSRWFGRVEAIFSRVARKRTAAAVLVGLSALTLRLAILPADPIPHPFIHDEFSFLLAGDTFASGRLTNPMHPMWKHFETFYVDFQPSYMSMYPPGQGLVLALGKAVFGHPWFGVWLSCGVLCAVLCWMLQGWLPPAWALLGAILCLVRIGLFSDWINSYNGGAVGAIGGALVLGALPRLVARINAVQSMILGVGLSIVAISRPWECLWLGIGIAVVLLRRLRSGQSRSWWRGLLVPLAGTLLVAGLALGYYNWRVFGSPLTLPYVNNRATYAVVPMFFWKSVKPQPEYRYPEIATFYVSMEMDLFRRMQGFGGFCREACRKFAMTTAFFFAIALIPPLFAFPKAVRNRRIKDLLIVVAVFSIGPAIVIAFFPRYISPVACALYAILITCFRYLRAWRFGEQPVGRTMVRLLCTVSIVCAGLRLAAQPLHIRVERFPTLWYGTESYGMPRAGIEAKLESLPGKHLLFVHYTPDHDCLDEWVYNAADIDASKVVWARDAGPQNAELLQYYKDRQAWIVEPDRKPPRLSPYELPAR